VAPVEKGDGTTKDLRRRNSMTFHIAKFLTHEDDDYTDLLDMVKDEFEARLLSVNSNSRDQKFAEIADTIAQGNLKELQKQVILNFRNLGRKYKEHFFGTTVLHLICQEGYTEMLRFVVNPNNHSAFDDGDLDLNVLNDRKRTPLHYVFAAPHTTYMALKHGLDENLLPKAVKAEEIEELTQWVKPGGPSDRVELVQILIEHGADVNALDLHDYTPMHYAAMWGWAPVLHQLVQAGGDYNAPINTGRTPLMLAVEYQNELAVQYLCSIKKLHVNLADAEGNTALVLCALNGKDGNEMAVNLLKSGADPNMENRKKKCPLSIACEDQNIDLVDILMDYKVQRRGSLFAKLQGDAMKQLTKRLDKEQKDAEREAKRIEDEKARDGMDGGVDVLAGGFRKKSPWGQWVQYNDKRGRGVFYYNVVSRMSQWDAPKDFKLDKKKEIKEATFGMSFYH